MARIEKSIEINSSAQEIWPMIYWDRIPEWMDIIRKAKYTSKERDGIGVEAHVLGEAGGVKVEWNAETIEWRENGRFGWRTTSGTFTGIGSMTFIPIKTGTKATFVVDYELPYSILGKIIDKLRLCKAIEKGTENGLKKLKEIIEEEKDKQKEGN